MRIALVADAFPPMRTSGAVQLRDLVRQFAVSGHAVTVFVSAPELNQPWLLEDFDSFKVLRLRTPKTKDIGYIRRTINEFRMPYAMLKNLKTSPVGSEQWEGIIWYSPSIFFGPLVSVLKQKSGCRSYLIIRDIFPEWAADMGLMSRGIPYKFFKAIANYQYSLADVIGIQSQGNDKYFKDWIKGAGRRLEVLNNWIGEPATRACSIQISETVLRGRTIFVYAGNMGVAQGMDVLLNLADSLRHKSEVGFVFVGRGSESARLKREAAARNLSNTLFFDEIDPDEIPALYAQCHVGLLALDQKHKSHIIPGKFLTYMQAGLPVLAVVNSGNDLSELIRDERVGVSIDETSVEKVSDLALELINSVETNKDFADRCKALAKKMFSAEIAVNQIVEALRN